MFCPLRLKTRPLVNNALTKILPFSCVQNFFLELVETKEQLKIVHWPLLSIYKLSKIVEADGQVNTVKSFE